jgi:Ca2+-transporting ATPase
MQPLTSPHALAAADVAATLGVDPHHGLTAAEAARRRAVDGPNDLEPSKPTSPVGLVLEAIREPFVLLLAVAGVLAIAVGEVRDGLLILVGLIPIVGADVVTEYRGERALAALREASAPRARVRRGGEPIEIPAADVVVGDLVLVRVGDVVPADLRIVTAERLNIDRAVLTGESIPEPATDAPDPPDAALTERRSMAYAGTSVVAGRGEGIVVATAAATEVGVIASSLAGRQRRRSPLQRELDRLVRILLFVAIALIAITTGLGFIRGNPLGENILAGISAAIAAIPEEPPVLLAVILGLGAYRLLKRGVLVRRLNAEEILGAVDLIVTDKTGTLTENRLMVAQILDADGAVTDASRRRELLVDALRAEDDAWAPRGTGRSSFTASIGRAVEAEGGQIELDPADLVESSPFDSTRPFTATVSRRDGLVETLAIGAPEAVLALASPADPAVAAAWHGRIVETAGLGHRVVGVARQRDRGPWEMRALLAFADATRAGIPAAVRAARGAGIQVVIVTGDHPATAAAIAREVGLDGDAVTLGSDLEAWTDAELADRLTTLRVVARSTPAQKRRIVAIAKGAGRLVAVTGDGVNDAPALHAADVAVAMGSGTAVAKEASDLVLGDDSFASLVFGVHEGRRIVDNVQKGLVFLTSTHVALLGFILVATLAGFSQPLLPIQILWLELFIDLSTSVAFEREPAEPDVMTRPPRAVGRPLLTQGLLGRVSLAGSISLAAAFALLALDPAGLGHGQWLAYTALVCAQAVRAYSNRSLTTPLARLGLNRFLLAASVTVIAIQVAIPAIPGLAEAFRAVPLTAVEWLLVAVIALAPAIVADAIRRITGRAWVA